MVSVERSALVSYSCEQMFVLVNDIEKYPEYMPGCVGSEVLNHGDGWLTARLDLAMMGLRQSFATKNILSPPHSMRMDLIDGPFKRLNGEWQFKELNDTACKVSFWLEFEVNASLVAIALPKIMEHAASQQVSALCQRAKDIYGGDS